MDLEKYLKKYAITKTGFARRIGVTYITMNNITSRKAYPSAKVAQRIVKLTNGEVTFEDLFKERN